MHGHLERIQLGTPYPLIVERVRGMLMDPRLRGQTELVVDATGVGRPVVDMLRQARLNPKPISITGGMSPGYEGGEWRVPKRDLVGVLQVLLQTERLKFAANLPAVPTLVQEMMAFKVAISTAGHDSYGSWREGAHDDLVLACAVACWYAEKPQPRRSTYAGMSYTVG